MKIKEFTIPFQYFKYSGLVLLCSLFLAQSICYLFSQRILDNINEIYATAIVYGLLLVIACICFRKVFLLSFQHLKKSHIKVAAFMYCFLLAYFGNGLSNLAIILCTQAVNANQQGLDSMKTPENALLFFMISVLFGPIVEELVFRGYLFRLLRGKTFLLAHISVAILFGIYHNSGEIFIDHNFSQLLFLIPYGFNSIAATILYEKTDNIFFRFSYI